MENGQKQAFPSDTHYGMTKREIFAAMAMQGLISARYSDAEGNARYAVSQADALLRALEQDQPQKAS